jgi:hypothetical protein
MNFFTALSSLVSLFHSFDWVAALRRVLQPHEAGAAGHALALDS